jgi:hypothetical protein
MRSFQLPPGIVVSVVHVEMTISNHQSPKNNERDLRDEEPGINKYALLPRLDGCSCANMLRLTCQKATPLTITLISGITGRRVVSEGDRFV